LEENVRDAEAGIKFALDRRAHFITNSEATRAEFLSEYDADPARVTVTPLAVDRSRFTRVDDPDASSRIRSKYGITERPFFLALSTLEPRKNLINTARAFVSFRREHPDTETLLVIAGREGWKFGDLLSDQSARDERIFFTGFVDDDDLPVLYSNAIALLFISHYEGFGLPALEGMSCGLPVVYGVRGALPEVVGDGGLPADPNDVDDIQEKLARIALNPGLREELSTKALARADQFSWADTVDRTLQIYLRMSGQTPSASLRQNEDRNRLTC
jgi:glycosyltransferase involved in cell wall biosynthesis